MYDCAFTNINLFKKYQRHKRGHAVVVGNASTRRRQEKRIGKVMFENMSSFFKNEQSSKISHNDFAYAFKSKRSPSSLILSFVCHKHFLIKTVLFEASLKSFLNSKDSDFWKGNCLLTTK